MALKITSLFCIVIVGIIMERIDARACFTTPPNVTEIGTWQAYNLPDLNSDSYEHNTHICPHGYVRDFAYSHLTTEYYKGQTVYKIMSYAVCCEGGALYAMNVLLS